MRGLLKRGSSIVLDLLALPLLLIAALLSRFRHRPVDVGLGPEPLINNIHHAQALRLYGYSAETFVQEVYSISDAFDVRADRWPGIFRPYALCLHCLFRYRCVYLYFNGGPLCGCSLRRIEPLLFRMARIRTVVMPYGSDVHDMWRCPNPLLKHVMGLDYPKGQRRVRRKVSAQVDRWTRWADCVISGCDWVYYMYHWDRLMLAHFSLDLSLFPLGEPALDSNELTILHAPNHRAIKGTAHFQAAVEHLRKEGFPVRLKILEKLSNEELRREIYAADLIADQLIIGWYGLFALEACASSKPVICYLDGDLVRAYCAAGLIVQDELPFINCTPATLTDSLRALLLEPSRLRSLGAKGRAFVERHHSVLAIGKVFDEINTSIGVLASLKAKCGQGGLHNLGAVTE